MPDGAESAGKCHWRQLDPRISDTGTDQNANRSDSQEPRRGFAWVHNSGIL